MLDPILATGCLVVLYFTVHNLDFFLLLFFPLSYTYHRQPLTPRCRHHLISGFFSTHSLTSLKDLMPSSPTISLAPCTIQSAYQISISNLLVKQAAWAYLQPMPVLASSNKHFFPSLPPPTRACVVFFTIIARALNRVLGAIRGCEFSGTWQTNHRYVVGVS